LNNGVTGGVAQAIVEFSASCASPALGAKKLKKSPERRGCFYGDGDAKRSDRTMPLSTLPINWAALQNGSDIRGVALDGVAGEVVNLPPDVVATLGKAFATWLSAELSIPTAELAIAVGRDSRLSGPTLMQAVIDGMTALGCRVLRRGHGLDPGDVYEHRAARFRLPRRDHANRQPPAL
jgi:hypothetical protein